MTLLEGYLHQTCTVLIAATSAPDDAYVVEPDPIEPGTSYPCRSVKGNRLVRGPNGEQLTATVTIRLAPDVTIAVGDFVRLSGDDTTYRVIDVSESIDLLGGLMGYRVSLV